MKAQPILLLVAGLVAGLAASCYATPATEGLPCEEDTACDKGERCAGGKCRIMCEHDYECPGDDNCFGGACLPGGGGGADGGDGGDTGGGDDGDTGGGDDDGTGGDPPGDDPEYPRPDGEGNCPPEMATLSGAPFCAPPCRANDMCPDGATGGANGECVFNPDSSADDCTETQECPDPAEDCVDNAGGDMSCLLPATHCVLFCDADAQNCPIQMECDQGICVYP